MASYPGVAPRPYVTSPRSPWPRMALLDSYILREMTVPFLTGLATYLVFQFFNIFFLAADYIINQHAPVILVLSFLVFRLPQMTPLAFVFACLFGTMLAFGRLVADNEIVALRTAGVSFWRIARIPLLVGVATSLLSYYVNETITPAATQLSTRTFYQIIYHTAALPIEPQIFRKDSTTGTTFYVESVDPVTKAMHNVQIFKRDLTGGSPFVQIVTAKDSYIADGSLHMLKPTIVRFSRDGTFGGETQDAEMIVGLPLGQTGDEFLNQGSSDPMAMDTKTLSAQIKANQSTGKGGAEVDSLRIILAQRHALPVGCFIAVLVALPLATIFGRRGRELGMALSMVVMFIYYLAAASMTALGKNGVVDPTLASWTPNLIIGTTGLVLLRRAER